MENFKCPNHLLSQGVKPVVRKDSVCRLFPKFPKREDKSESPIIRPLFFSFTESMKVLFLHYKKQNKTQNTKPARFPLQRGKAVFPHRLCSTSRVSERWFPLLDAQMVTLPPAAYAPLRSAMTSAEKTQSRSLRRPCLRSRAQAIPGSEGVGASPAVCLEAVGVAFS